MKHVNWKALSYFAYGLLFILLFYLLARTQLNFQYSAKHITDNYYPLHMLSSLLFCLLGFLSTKQWFLYIKSKEKSIHFKLLALGIVLLILCLIPILQWMIWLGLHSNLFAFILQSTYVNHAISMLAGVVIGKSFTNNPQS